MKNNGITHKAQKSASGARLQQIQQMIPQNIFKVTSPAPLAKVGLKSGTTISGNITTQNTTNQQQTRSSVNTNGFFPKTPSGRIKSKEPNTIPGVQQKKSNTAQRKEEQIKEFADVKMNIPSGRNKNQNYPTMMKGVTSKNT